MDNPVQILNQTLLKETHHKRYKEVSERESDDSIVNSGMNNPETGGIFQDECLDSLEEIDKTPSSTATLNWRSFVYKFKKIIIFSHEQIRKWTRTDF